MAHILPEVLKGPFTVDDYYRMVETGILSPESRVELLDGIVVEMSPIGVPHASCLNRLTEKLVLALAGRATTSIQLPVRLDIHNEPQPDVAVLRHRRDGYAHCHPGPSDVFFLIEVADTTARKDREVKVPLYSRAGIPEVWLVRLDTDCLEVFREPGPHGYAIQRTVRRGESLTPLLLDLELPVSDVLG